MNRKTLYNFNSVQLTFIQCVFTHTEVNTELNNLYSTRLDKVDSMKVQYDVFNSTRHGEWKLDTDCIKLKVLFLHCTPLHFTLFTLLLHFPLLHFSTRSTLNTFHFTFFDALFPLNTFYASFFTLNTFILLLHLTSLHFSLLHFYTPHFTLNSFTGNEG